MGRPAKLIKRKKRVTVNYTLAEYLFVQSYAEERGISIAQYVRARSLDERPSIKRTPEGVAAYWELVSLANNLNKTLQRLDHTQIDKTLDQLNQLINQLK